MVLFGSLVSSVPQYLRQQLHDSSPDLDPVKSTDTLVAEVEKIPAARFPKSQEICRKLEIKYIFFFL